MVDVARILWKFAVGVKDFLVLIFLILFFVALFGLLSASPNPGRVTDGVLLLKLDGMIVEQPGEIDPLTSLTSGGQGIGEYRQRDIVRALRLAENDDRVKAVALDLDRFAGGGQVSLAAIGDRLDAMKDAGKPVYAYATAYMDDGYQLAAHASEIWVNPLGGVVLTGPGGQRSYYKGLLEQTGIEAHIYRVGTYKSAVEPFLRSDQSPEAKEALSAVYAEYWDAKTSDIKKARPKASLDALISDPAGLVEEAKGDFLKIALGNGLVDKSGDRVAFGKYLAEKYGAPKDKNKDELLAGDFAHFDMQALLATKNPDDDGDPIAVITAAGPIVDGGASGGTAGSDTISKLIYQAVADDDVKAIVLRVDSPGGSVTASEQIRLALNEAKAKKLPIVVSMANVAASGGYWISTPADAIFAEQATITGSIGIFGILPSAGKALARFGITSDGVKTTPLSGEPNFLGGVDDDFHRVAQSVVEKGYGDFVSRVAKSRGKTPEQVDSMAQGRIWAGGTARQLGLVDRIGGLDMALEEAAKLSKLKKGDWHAKYMEPRSSFLAGLVGQSLPVSSAHAPPMDIFARAALSQQQARRAIWQDLSLLSGVKGTQVYCLQCSGFAPATGPKIQSRQHLWELALTYLHLD